MDQRLAAENSRTPEPSGLAKGEVHVRLSADQMCPPIGSEVTLARTDGTRVPMVLTAIDPQGYGEMVLIFFPVVTP